MNPARLVTAFGLAAALVAMPSLADAQSRRAPSGPSTGRAVPRTGPPPHAGGGRTYGPSYNHPNYYRPYYPPYYYRPYYYAPGFYGPYAFGYAFGYPAFGFGVSFSYGYPGYYGYGGYGYPGYAYPAYGYGGYGYRPYGGVRIDIAERNAEVYVDSYYSGIVDDFDGSFQQLNVEPGPHRIEIRAAGSTPISFDVNVEPGRTITYRTARRPERP